MASNQVNFRVGLPTAWNLDFYFQGLGGLAGHLGTLDAGLSRGYASASTDTGHQGSTLYPSPELDGGWALNNRPKQIDYGYRGVHVRDDCHEGDRGGVLRPGASPFDLQRLFERRPARTRGGATLP